MNRPWLVHERRVQLISWLGGLPAATVAFAMLWTGDYTARVQWTLTLLIAGVWLACSASVRQRVATPFRTLANLLEAIHEGDYSVRARGAAADGAMGEAMQQANLIGSTMLAQRLGQVEATALLRRVMEVIDVAVFTFDGEQKLKFVNREGARLLNAPAERLADLDASALGLAEFLEGEQSRTVQCAFPGATGRWGISRSGFREGGRPHCLLVVSDLTRPLREEELLAWQRIVRVLGHELNNSLTPIKSIAASLASLLAREPLPDDWKDDTQRGLAVIATRSEALSRFIAAYARLAKLPRPVFAPLEIGRCIERVAGLETRLKPSLLPGPAATVQADRDQLEQLLINLLRNAVDAALETGGGVDISWQRVPAGIEIVITDAGPGLSDTPNLFVPFFTTKPGGSGIGLVLSRQIAEAHGGSLILQNRAGQRGCEARLTLPV